MVFNEDQQVATRASVTRKNSAMEDLVIRTGLVKTPRGAKRVLLAILALCAVGIIVLWIRSGTSVGSSYGNYDTFIETHPELITE